MEFFSLDELYSLWVRPAGSSVTTALERYLYPAIM
jgi:hypothetical protein